MDALKKLVAQTVFDCVEDEFGMKLADHYTIETPGYLFHRLSNLEMAVVMKEDGKPSRQFVVKISETL